uniref:Uncharacterized protein n=1 Tax=Pristionchus pacificus TaxID=54126 RepID=A0A2A6CG31_PRIPA|eukprot:PDM77013.1 hypothetical protein PRIPAC_42408 [Pristionchus pacificus]
MARKPTGNGSQNSPETVVLPLLSLMEPRHELFEDFFLAARAISDVIDTESDLSRLLDTLEE